MKALNVIMLATTFLAVPVYAADSPELSVPAGLSGRPAAITPATTPVGLSSNAAEVVKLSVAGVGDEVVLAYIKNSQAPFNLSADAILRLKDAGVATPMIAAMLTHDHALMPQRPPAVSEPPPGLAGPGQPYPQTQPQPQVAAPLTVAPVDQTPPPARVEVVTVAPGPDYYWTPGYWGWNGGWGGYGHSGGWGGGGHGGGWSGGGHGGGGGGGRSGGGHGR